MSPPSPWSSVEGCLSPTKKTHVHSLACSESGKLNRRTRCFGEGSYPAQKYFSEPVTFQSALPASAPVAQAVQRAVEPPIGPSFFGPCRQASLKLKETKSQHVRLIQ